MNFQDGFKFNVTVLDGQRTPIANQTVKFNVNGVFYERTSKDNGVASLNINLMSGEYYYYFHVEWFPNWKHDKKA